MPANAITGLEMNKFCNEPRNTPGEVSCITYMSGLLDGMYLADKMSANGNRYCLPGDKNIDAEQGVLIVKNTCENIRNTCINKLGLSPRLRSI